MSHIQFAIISFACCSMHAVAADVAVAQSKFFSSTFAFDRVPPPTSVSWQLATDAGQHVDLVIHDVFPLVGGQQLNWQVQSSNALQYGVDWAAWSAAAVDPAFTRSIVSFGGTSHEESIVRNWADFELDIIGVSVIGYEWPLGGLTVRAGGAIIDAPNVPEPGSLLLAVTASLFTAVYTTARRSQRLRS